MSLSTANFDRGGKFADYQTAKSLQEYVLVSQSQMSIEYFRKNEQGILISQTYSRGEEVNFAVSIQPSAIKLLLLVSYKSFIN